MKAWRRRADWQRAFPVLAVLAAIAAGPDVAASLAARNVQLLSWQQSGREGSRQTLVLTGTFADLLTWLNDWPAACPLGTCQILCWERGEGGSVVTIEVSPDGKAGAALH